MRSPYGETWAPKTAQQATAATERTTAKRARRPLRTGIAANRSMRKPFWSGGQGRSSRQAAAPVAWWIRRTKLQLLPPEGREPCCRFPRLTTVTIQARTPVVAALLAGSILLTSCAGLRDDGAAAPGPDTPISSTPDPSAPPGKPTPLLVEPRPDLVDIRPQPWDKARVIDPRTVEVRFYGGIEECYGVARVDVDYRKRSVVITVYGGRVPTAEVCIEIAVLKAVRVDLTEPLAGRRVVDGAEQAA
jgi:hypothetical protein